MKKSQSTSQVSTEQRSPLLSEQPAALVSQHAWRQGSLLPEAAHNHLSCSLRAGQFAMIASHDCDCVRSPDLEPNVEVVVGRYIDEVNGNYTKAKSSRLLHLSIAGSKFLELDATLRGAIDKTQLLAFTPVEEILLDTKERRHLARWLALRYDRPSLPDELIRRLRKRNTKDIFTDACKKFGKEIQGIYITFEPLDRELPSDEIEPYSVEIKVVWDTEAPNGEAAAVDVAERIRKKFVGTYHKSDGLRQEWMGIELQRCEAVPDLDFSLRDIRSHFAWNNDEISLGDDSALPVR